MSSFQFSVYVTILSLFCSASAGNVGTSDIGVTNIDSTNDFLQFVAPPNFDFITDDIETLPATQELNTTSNASARLNSKLTSVITRLDAIKSIPLIGNFLSVVKIRDQKQVSDGDEELGAKVNRYLRSRSIRFRLPQVLAILASLTTKTRSFDIDLAKLAALNTEEGRGRIKKLILPIVLLLIVKFILLLPVFLSGIALVSLNGLWAGVTALFVATALGLRALFGRDLPGYAPRLAVIQPNFLPGFQPQYLASDSVQVQAGLVPVWSRNGVQPDLPFRGHPPIAPQ